MADGEEPKIIVDSDWKSEAQAEKAKLAEQEAQQPEDGKGGEPIKASFEELVKTMATQALMYMGAFPDPTTGKAIVALDYARFNIDLLGVVEEKTKGNLSDEEQTLISQILQDLRVQFVEISKALAKAAEEGKLSPMNEGGTPPTA